MAGESQGHSSGSGSADRSPGLRELSSIWGSGRPGGENPCQSKERKPNTEKTRGFGRGSPWSQAECCSHRCARKRSRRWKTTVDKQQGDWCLQLPGPAATGTSPRSAREDAVMCGAQSKGPMDRRLTCGLLLPNWCLLLLLLRPLCSCLGVICSSFSSFLKGKLDH